ncbi:MAG TPA: DoxX family protein [Acidobacteriaceae bacterium]|nr:DoxX family protein [Acidobacteriaceae bacterium]
MLSWLNRFEGLGSLIMRVVVGVIMVAHGYTKVIPSGSLYTFAHTVTRMHLPVWLGYVSAFTEFFGGMLLVVGLLTRLAAFMVAIDMSVAIIKVHLHGGLLGQNSFALPLTIFASSLMLVFTGCGWLGLDDFLGRTRGARARVGAR